MKMSVFNWAIVASLLVSSSAYKGACTEAYASEKSSDPVTLDYATLVGLPYNVRISYIEAFRNVLLEMDSDHPESHAALDWMLDQILCSAEAHPNDSFCINLGVVQEAASCPDEFHNFDTGKYFQGSGLTTADPICAEGGLPCSPYFGFDKSGNLYCSKTNQTKVCEKKSEDKSTIQFADVVKKCALQGASAAKINCDKLPEFMHGQQNIVNAYCQNSHRACGILRDQVRSDLKMVVNIISSSDADEVAKISAYLGLVNTEKPVNNPAKNCPPETPPATVPDPTAATQASSTTGPTGPSGLAAQPAESGGLAPPAEVKHQDCKDQREMKGSHLAGDQDFKEIWGDAFPPGSRGGCVQFKTPSGLFLTLNNTAMSFDGLIEFPNGADGKPSKPPISLDGPALFLMRIMAQVFEGPSYKLDPATLLKHYLPTTQITQSGVIKDGDKNYPALEYTTEDGTKIRYTTADDGSELVTLGSAVSQVFSYRVRPPKS